MVTRFRVGSNRLPKHLNIHVSTISPYLHRIQIRLMIQIGKMLFRHKHLTYGTLSRYKARLVVNGSAQLSSIDVDETFSPVVKPATIQTVLSLATSRHWLVHQLDVNNALYETVYIHQPLGFGDSTWLNYVCLLQQLGIDSAYLLLYVDDIVLTASSEILLQQIINSLHQEFSMRDLGSLNCFLGISIARDSSYDWAGFPTTRRSTLGYFVFLGNNLLPWSSKRQPTLSRSSAKVEYREVANAVAKT
ncbi:ribonuclease H-like domain-containing protein [Tanacetum coccineum]|uniref:Ribonuclease H-like domain-containing protein n=1 Tax=Tanacetum coccineum TaxID=301880 RepID=A0ABQ5A9Q0_9ASTR